MDNYTVKDSGDRREFASGAVRDMQKGKGRCDLLPLAELATLIDNMDIKKDYIQTIMSSDGLTESWIFRHFNNAINALNTAKDADNKTIEKISYEIVDCLYVILEIFLIRFYKYPECNNGIWSTLYDALNSVPEDFDAAIKAHVNNVVYSAILDLAQHFEAGASKYGDNNWRKGIPINVFIDSAIRHFCKFMRGDMDEPHHVAFMWNVICCIWTINNLGLIIQEEQK